MKQFASRRFISRHRCFILWSLIFALIPLISHADRASENMDPAYMYEKKGVYGPAAMYYGRMLRGLSEIYMAFHTR